MKTIDFYNIPQYTNADDIHYYVVVFTKDSFVNDYTVEERSYIFSTDNKYFKSYTCGNSLFANCLDKKDKGVRLDWYFGEWKIDYCYEVDKDFARQYDI